MPRTPYIGGDLYGMGVSPFNPRPMKTPEQYKADLLRQLQPNLDAYNLQYDQFQRQQSTMANTGHYIKVSSYDEVKEIQATSDGKPVIIIDDKNGMLYSKKFENGSEYIKAFRLMPAEAQQEVNKKEAHEDPAKEETPKEKVASPLEEILNKLESMESRLTKLEGVPNDEHR